MGAKVRNDSKCKFKSFCDLYATYEKSLYHCKKIGLNPFGNAGRTTNNVQVQQLSNLIDASEKVSVSGLAGSSYAFLVAQYRKNWFLNLIQYPSRRGYAL